jgi:hypothetical protein
MAMADRISAATGDEVSLGGVLGLHGEVEDLLEAHRGGRLTGGVVSTGARFGRRGMAVRGGIRWWWSTTHDLGRRLGHRRLLGWPQWSRRTTCEA